MHAPTLPCAQYSTEMVGRRLAGKPAEISNRDTFRTSLGLPAWRANHRIMSSPVCKNISVFPKRKSALYRQLSRPSRRGVAQRHRRGAGCGGRW